MIKKERVRRCIVTRHTKNISDMIRFVVDPQGSIVADLKGKLPGRGLWLTNNRQIVQKAIQQNLFSAGSRKKTVASENILQSIENLLLEDIQQGLSMAKKSGAIITGFSRVEALARKGEVNILFHARDGGRDGMDKIRLALVVCQRNGGYEKGLPILFDTLSSSQIDKALGTGNTVHVAAVKSGVTDYLKKKIGRFLSYCNEPA